MKSYKSRNEKYVVINRKYVEWRYVSQNYALIAEVATSEAQIAVHSVFKALIYL